MGTEGITAERLVALMRRPDGQMPQWADQTLTRVNNPTNATFQSFTGRSHRLRD